MNIKKIAIYLLTIVLVAFGLCGCEEFVNELETAVTYQNVADEKTQQESFISEEKNVEEATIVSEETSEHEDAEAVNQVEDNSQATAITQEYVFRNKKLLNQHYEKHGIEMGFSNAKEYEKAASAVINNPNALHKIEKEDGDDVFYVEATNEFAVLSTDGYIRTYFKPDSGKKYFDKQ